MALAGAAAGHASSDRQHVLVVADLQQQLGSLRDLLAAKEEELAGANAALEDARAAAAAAAAGREADLSAQLAALQAQLGELGVASESRAAAAAELSAAHCDAVAALSGAEARAATLQARLDVLAGSEAALQEQLRAAEARPAELQRLLDLTEARAAELAERLGTAEAHAADLQQRLELAEAQTTAPPVALAGAASGGNSDATVGAVAGEAGALLSELSGGDCEAAPARLADAGAVLVGGRAELEHGHMATTEAACERCGQLKAELAIVRAELEDARSALADAHARAVAAEGERAELADVQAQLREAEQSVIALTAELEQASMAAGVAAAAADAGAQRGSAGGSTRFDGLDEESVGARGVGACADGADEASVGAAPAEALALAQAAELRARLADAEAAAERARTERASACEAADAAQVQLAEEQGRADAQRADAARLQEQLQRTADEGAARLAELQAAVADACARADALAADNEHLRQQLREASGAGAGGGAHGKDGDQLSPQERRELEAELKSLDLGDLHVGGNGGEEGNASGQRDVGGDGYGGPGVGIAEDALSQLAELRADVAAKEAAAEKLLERLSAYEAEVLLLREQVDAAREAEDAAPLQAECHELHAQVATLQQQLREQQQQQLREQQQQQVAAAAAQATSSDDPFAFLGAAPLAVQPATAEASAPASAPCCGRAPGGTAAASADDDFLLDLDGLLGGPPPPPPPQTAAGAPLLDVPDAAPASLASDTDALAVARATRSLEADVDATVSAVVGEAGALLSELRACERDAAKLAAPGSVSAAGGGADGDLDRLLVSFADVGARLQAVLAICSKGGSLVRPSPTLPHAPPALAKAERTLRGQLASTLRDLTERSSALNEARCDRLLAALVADGSGGGGGNVAPDASPANGGTPYQPPAFAPLPQLPGGGAAGQPGGWRAPVQPGGASVLGSYLTGLGIGMGRGPSGSGGAERD
eukprot:315100-Chlamydomonas_euryale.AAC.10